MSDTEELGTTTKPSATKVEKRKRESKPEAEPERKSGRERKAVDQLVIVSTPKTEFKVKAGLGTKLSEISRVAERLKDVTRSEPIYKSLHTIMYARPGKETTIKKNVLAFSGLEVTSAEVAQLKKWTAKNSTEAPTADAVSKELAKAWNRVHKLTVAELKQICTLLDIPREKSKEATTASILTFLAAPEESETATRAPVKSGKRKSTSGAKSPKAKKPATEKASKEKKPKDAPKAALSAYFIFAGEKRAQIKADHPDLSLVDVARKLGEQWSTVSPDEKQRYEKLAAEDKERYAADKAEWEEKHPGETLKRASKKSKTETKKSKSETKTAKKTPKKDSKAKTDKSPAKKVKLDSSAKADGGKKIKRVPTKAIKTAKPASDSEESDSESDDIEARLVTLLKKMLPTLDLNTTSRKVREQLQEKLGVDLTNKKKFINDWFIANIN